MKLHKKNGLRPELEAMDTHELNLLLQQEAAPGIKNAKMGNQAPLAFFPLGKAGGGAA